MKYISTRCFLGLLINLLVGISANNQSVSATVLTFDFGGGFSPNYGDNVITSPQAGYIYGSGGTPTPLVAVDYSGSVGNYGPGYGTLANVIYGADNDGLLDVTLTAEPDYLVSLDFFVMAGYSSNYVIDAVQVLDGDDIAWYSIADTLISGLTFTLFDFSTSPFVSQVIRIHIDASNLGFDSDNIGIDNVQFSQIPVPEPASILLAISGGLFFMGLRRWHRREAIK